MRPHFRTSETTGRTANKPLTLWMQKGTINYTATNRSLPK